MSRAGRILLVEDHRETVEFLSSLLQMAQSGHQIVAVHSAEEAVLEIQQASFELLVTDLQLPGMDGLELARQARRYQPGIRTVLISGQAIRPRPEELELAGVRHYFKKPLDTAAFLEVIAALLATGTGPLGQSAAQALPEKRAKQLTIESRLEHLRTDTGALQVLVADRDGAVLFAAGGDDPALNRALLAALLARGLEHSDGVSRMLQAASPAGIYYYLGRQQDVFCTNIDAHHFLVVVIAAGQRRGGIGALWVYGQKAAVDLRASLREQSAEAAAQPAPPPAEAAPAPPPPRPRPAAPAAAREESRPEKAPAHGADDDLDQYWEQAAGSEPNEALFPRRFSLEEARRKGLIPPEFTPDANT